MGRSCEVPERWVKAFRLSHESYSLITILIIIQTESRKLFIDHDINYNQQVNSVLAN